MTRRYRLLIPLFPLLAYALPFAVFASTAAGFAPGALWLSKTEASAGDTVKVYTVLYDSSANAIEGDVDFDVDGDSIQTLHFKLAAGESRMLSADWTAQEGAHTFSAQLKNISGVPALAALQTNAVKISVSKGVPALTTTYINVANNFIASTSPELGGFLGQVASTTESWRQAGAEWLSKQLYTDQSLAKTAAASGLKPAVLGTSTANVQDTPQQSSIFGTLKHWALTGLLYIFNIRILFYLVLLIVLFVLYKLVRAMFRLRRPSD